MPFITTALWILNIILPFSFQVSLLLSDILTTLNYLYSLNIPFNWNPCLYVFVFIFQGSDQLCEALQDYLSAELISPFSAFPWCFI